MIRRYFFLVLLSLLVNLHLSGQEGYVRFKRITINDGLSLSSVYTIYQDSKGFMWFGTEDGLNRYDGRTISVYGATGDQFNVLANKWIELVYEDKSGMIWLGSRGGLTRFNPRKGIFTVLRHDPNSESSLSNDTVTAITSDLHNDVWVGTFSGLNKVDRITSGVERFTTDEVELEGLTSRITCFQQDNAGMLWIGTYRGLFSYDPKSGLFFNEDAGGILDPETIIYHLSLSEEELWVGTSKGIVKIDLSPRGEHQLLPVRLESPEERITNTLKDNQGQVWIQTSKALYCYGKEMGLQHLLSLGNASHSLALNPTEPLLEDRDGYIWLGTFGDGVYKIDPATLDYHHFSNNPADPQSLSENAINTIFQDRSGAMWFGTFGAGISILDPQSNRFTLFKNDPFNKNSLASSFVWTIFETKDSTLWIGTNDNGISCYHETNGTFSHFDHDPFDPFSLSHSSVRKIYQDSRGRIWIGTDGGGLDLFRPEDKSFEHFRNDPRDPASISDNSVRAIYEDRYGRVWVGTRNGLNLLSGDGTSFRRYLTEAGQGKQLQSNFVYSAIYLDGEDNLWVGTYGGGLCRMDPGTGDFIDYHNDPEEPTSISDNIVYSLFEDNLGRFWVGTNSGLNMFYPATESFRRFGINEGLANEVIYGILPDDDDRIWLSTNLGVSQFDLESFESKNFDMNDGLQSNEFNGGAYFRSEDGRLFFGGVYGLSVIDPKKIEPVRNVAQVTLTKLEVLGKEVKVADVNLEEEFEEQPGRIVEYEGDYYSSENATYLEEIVLDYKDRFFSVEFAALNYLQPGKLTYSYMMENLESDWTNAGDRNYVSYANMKAGSYVLKVIAENADGYRSDPPLQLRITVTPPYWKSWWFLLLEVLVVSAVVVMIYIYLVKSRTNRLLKYQNQQISQANAALRESEQNLMQLNATKDKFFSIISHDLKNPFSSLLSISELMVESFEDADREDHRAGFKKINQSVKHLLDLLENLLTWSRSQRGKIKYNPVRFNLSNLIHENINLHKLFAEKKGIMLLSPKEGEFYAYGDRDMINSVIRNLITNAVKFTDRDKKVEVLVHADNGTLEVSIVDEGIGISKENLEKLFRIDEKFKTNGTDGEKGTGLGLIICREFVEKNGGEINVTSKPGLGSTFSFTIPSAGE